jgi:hypothetical protein
MKQKVKERREAIAQLKKMVRPGRKVYTSLEHVSKSGMSRDISVFIVRKGEIFNITWLVGRILGLRRQDNGGIRIGGCGMDMGYHIVMNLSYALHGMKSKGQDAIDAEDKGRPFYGAKPGHYRAGYSLDHQWL